MQRRQNREMNSRSLSHAKISEFRKVLLDKRPFAHWNAPSKQNDSLKSLVSVFTADIGGALPSSSPLTTTETIGCGFGDGLLQVLPRGCSRVGCCGRCFGIDGGIVEGVRDGMLGYAGFGSTNIRESAYGTLLNNEGSDKKV